MQGRYPACMDIIMYLLLKFMSFLQICKIFILYKNRKTVRQISAALSGFEDYSLSAFILEAMLDFLRAALFLWSRPLDTARSTVLTAAL